MNVRFKGSDYGITYTVLEDLGIVYDDMLKKYCDCYRITALGQVPKELLEITNDDENATDVMVHIVSK